AAHVHVQQHQVHRGLADNVHRLLTTRGQEGPVAFRLHDVAQSLAAARVVVGNQDGIAGAVLGCLHAAYLVWPFLTFPLRGWRHNRAGKAIAPDPLSSKWRTRPETLAGFYPKLLI